MINTLTISVPEEMRKFIESQALEGNYASVSEYLRDLVRQKQREAEQRRFAMLIRDGLMTPVKPLTPSSRDAMKERVRNSAQSSRRKNA
jgi:antitoxin ParD1/3/4